VIDVMLEPGDYQAKFQENVMWGQDVRIYLALQWNEVQQVTRYREVTRYASNLTLLPNMGKIIPEMGNTCGLS
jgi:hypothetical protein